MPIVIERVLRGRHRPACLLVIALALAVVPMAGGEPHAAAQATGYVEGMVQARPARLRPGTVVFLQWNHSHLAPPMEPAVMDQRHLNFDPHVLPVLQGTVVQFANHDTIRHNVFSPDGEGYDLGTWPPGTVKARRFNRVGVYRQLCHLHPEMEAFIVVLDTPYFAVSADDGRFRISDVPAGSYTLKTWSNGLAPVAEPVTVHEGQATRVRLGLSRAHS